MMKSESDLRAWLRPQLDAYIRMSRRAEIVLGDLSGKGNSCHADNVTAAMELLFQELYPKWPRRVSELPIEDVDFALDHVLHNDSPDRPTVWEITK